MWFQGPEAATPSKELFRPVKYTREGGSYLFQLYNDPKQISELKLLLMLLKLL